MRRETIILSVFIVLSFSAAFCGPKAKSAGYHTSGSEPAGLGQKSESAGSHHEESASGENSIQDHSPDGKAGSDCDETYDYSNVLSHDPSHVSIEKMHLKTSIAFSKDGAAWNVAWHHCNPGDDKTLCKGKETEFDDCPCLMINFEQSDRSKWFDVTSSEFLYDAAMDIVQFGENSNVLIVRADLIANIKYASYTRYIWIFGSSGGLPAVIWEGVLGTGSTYEDVAEFPPSAAFSFKDQGHDGEPEMALKLCSGVEAMCRDLVLDSCGGTYPKYNYVKSPIQGINKFDDDE